MRGDAHLQLAHAGKVLVQLLPVGPAQVVFQACASSSTASRTLARSSLRLTRSGSLGRAENSRSNTSLRIDLRRQRRGGRAPGDRVLVHTGIAAVTVAGAAVAFDAEFQRRQPGPVAEPARGDLVDGDAGLEVRPGGLARLAAGQAGAAGAGVVAGAVAVGAGPCRRSSRSAPACPSGSGASGCSVGGSSKSAPSAVGVQSAMLAPLGT